MGKGRKSGANVVRWQSAQLNMAFKQIYLKKLETMAISRYKWLNLPATCSERYIELNLLCNGVVSIAQPPQQPGIFYSNQAAQMGRQNIYDDPSAWVAYGNNGWRFPANWSSGVLVFDNRLRRTIFNDLEAFARLLCQYDIALLGNLNAQKVSWLLKGDQTQINTMQQVLKQVLGGEPALVTTSGIDAIDISAISLQVPFIGEQLNAAKAQTWSDALALLGIDSLPRKAERMIQDEVLANNEPTSLIALDGLNCRREAAHKLNDRFGLDIQVVWAYDNVSDAYNAAVNPLLDTEEGGARNVDDIG